MNLKMLKKAHWLKLLKIGISKNVLKIGHNMISEVPKNYSQFSFRFLKRIDIEFFKSRLQINSLEWIFKLESKFLKELCNSCKIKGL